MTLTGQESRILTQYYFNAHPQNEAYKSLCSKYKEHSENQKKIENARRHLLTESMEKQKNLDDEFVERLKKFNTMDDDTE